MRTAIAVLLVLLAAAAGLAAPPTDAELANAAGVEWYGVYAQGTKIGHARIGWERDAAGGFLYRADYTMLLTALGSRTRIVGTECAWFAAEAPHPFLGGTSRMDMDGEVRIVAVGRTATGLRAVVSESGTRRTLDLPPTAYVLGDELRVARFILGRPAVGESVENLTYSLSDLVEDRNRFTVTAVREVLAGGVREQVYEGRMHSEKDGDSGTGVVDGDGRLLSMALGGMFELRAEPEEQAKDIRFSADLFVAGAVPVDVPLGDPGDLASLVLVVSGEGLDTIVAGPRQAVAPGEAPGTIVLTLGAAAADRVPATEEEVSLGLRATVEFPTTDPRIVALAQKAVGDAADPAEKVRRLTSFVSDLLEDEYGQDSLSVLQAVEKGVGDCTEHSALFVTLARAAGIPARTAGGLMYMGDDVQAFGGHAWAEVVLDGAWVPVDPTFDQPVADPLHVRFGADDRDTGPMLATMGRIRFTVKSMAER